jgi:hypothetical protein
MSTLLKTAAATRALAMMQRIRRSVLIEGYSVDKILGLSNEQLDQFLCQISRRIGIASDSTPHLSNPAFPYKRRAATADAERLPK